MHIATGNWKLGLTLALVASLMWGVLPIALKILLGEMDAYTLTWFRFGTSSLLLGAYLASRKKLPALLRLTTHDKIRLVIAVLGILANYVLYLVGLSYVSPGTAQIVIQLAPLFLLLGGILLFKEYFGAVQWLGLGVLIAGIVMFFNERFIDIVRGGNAYSFGVLLVFLSAIAWAAYGIALKQLLRQLSSQQIMLVVYIGSFVLLFPVSAPTQLLTLDGASVALLVALPGGDPLERLGDRCLVAGKPTLILLQRRNLAGGLIAQVELQERHDDRRGRGIQNGSPERVNSQ